MSLPNRLSKGEKEKLLKKVRRWKKEIEFDDNAENKHPQSKKEIEAWRKWCNLPQATQQQLRAKWDEYYQQVQESPIALLVKEQREALRRHDFARVKDLAAQAKQMRINGDHMTIPLPTSIDPAEFRFGWVKAYLEAEQQIKLLSDDLEVSIEEEAIEIFKEALKN